MAEQIADAIGEELVYIPDAIRNDKYEYTITEEETIGFCFPTHGWQPPRIVPVSYTHLTLPTKRIV